MLKIKLSSRVEIFDNLTFCMVFREKLVGFMVFEFRIGMRILVSFSIRFF